MSAEPCPCGGGAWVQCCGRWTDARLPDAPEALMRARYTAYTRCDAAMLLDTWHPDHRPPTVEFAPGVRWLGLKVGAVRSESHDRATVRFTARWRVGGGRAGRMTETSRFVHAQGRWWYLDGEVESVPAIAQD